MKATRVSTVLSILCFLIQAGCSDRGAPTQPSSAMALGGHWTGTITSLQSGTNAQGICRSDPVSADVSQDVGSVSATLVTSCAGSFDFTGRTDGSVLTGALASRSNEGAGGRVTGAVSSSRIQMKVGRSTKEEFIPLLDIQLVR